MNRHGVDIAALRWFVARLQPYRTGLLLVAALSMVQAALAVPSLLLMRRILDEAIPQRDAALLWYIGGAVLALRLAASALSLLVRSRVLRIVKTVVARLRGDLLTHLLARDRAFMLAADQGLLQTRLVQDTERLDSTASTIVAGVIPALTGVALILPLLASISLPLTAVGVLGVPVLLLVARASGARVSRALQAFRTDFDSFSRATQTLLRTTELIRLRAWQQPARDAQGALHGALRASGIRMGMAFAWQANLQRVVLGAFGTALLLTGGVAVIQGRMTLGQFLVFYLAAGMLQGHFDTLIGALSELASGSAASRALMTVLESGAPEPYQGRRAVTLAGNVALHDVAFHYDERPLLTNVSLALRPGRITALVGPNGAGKSTVAHLLMGAHRPHAGQVLFDDVPLDDLDVHALRRQLGMAPQHPVFFRGTVRDNLGFGHDTVAPAALQEALALSAADAVIARLAHGLDTVVGEGGARLSGGEMQRLSLARALLHRPAVLILDEPTTHLDAESVGHFLRGLESWSHQPAVLLISHDPEVLPYAHDTWQLTNGHLTPLLRPTRTA